VELFSRHRAEIDAVGADEPAAALRDREAFEAAVAAVAARQAPVMRTIHYYAGQGVIVTTTHPKGIPPRIYDQARAALGKQPDEGPSAQVVTAIMVVRPLTVTRGAEVAMAGQQVVSTRPETTLRISEY
jgi:hypothetical protein